MAQTEVIIRSTTSRRIHFWLLFFVLLSNGVCAKRTHTQHLRRGASAPADSALSTPVDSAEGARHVDVPQPAVLAKLCARGSYYMFHSYTSSEWEQDWLAHAHGRAGSICETMNQEGLHADGGKQWVESISKYTPGSSHDPSNMTLLEYLDYRVFSKFVFRDVCGSDSELVVPIEPLVGLMRHPYAFCGAAGLQDRSYMLVNPVHPVAFAHTYPGKKILLDLGTSYYKSGMAWFVNTYERTGVSFDELYGWEIRPLNHAQYFKEVPKHVVPKLHLYNFPVADDMHSAGHPYAVLRQIYEHGDFVVLKIDIDGKPALELGLVKLLMEHKSLQRMIAEVYFELHFDSKEVKPHFGRTGTPYAEAVQLFHTARSQGIRMHYWP